jgi:hypothetical protein
MRLFRRKPKFDWSPTQKRVKARMNEILDMPIDEFEKFSKSGKMSLLDLIAFSEIERKHEISKLNKKKALQLSVYDIN